MVFQHFNIFRTCAVEENISLAPVLLGARAPMRPRRRRRAA
jgi:ABC-type polar amino acid transport system ATPase subunit